MVINNEKHVVFRNVTQSAYLLYIAGRQITMFYQLKQEKVVMLQQKHTLMTQLTIAT